MRGNAGSKHTSGRAAEQKSQGQQKTQISISWSACFRVMIAIFLLYLAITWWKPLMSLIWHILSAALPLFIGFAIAYVVNILMSVYERHYFTKSAGKSWVRKTRRAVCLIGAVATVLGAIVLLLWIIIPQLASALTVITKQLPKALTSLSENAQVMELLPETIQDAIHELDYNKLISGVIDFLTNGATPGETASAVSAGRNLTGILGSLTSTFMTGFMSFIFS